MGNDYGNFVGEMVEGIVKGVATLIIMLLVVGVISIGAISYSIYAYCNKSTIKSKTKLTPVMQFKTDGTKIDTFYIYK